MQLSNKRLGRSSCHTGSCGLRYCYQYMLENLLKTGGSKPLSLSMNMVKHMLALIVNSHGVFV
jgi:hypothetical protein